MRFVSSAVLGWLVSTISSVVCVLKCTSSLVICIQIFYSLSGRSILTAVHSSKNLAKKDFFSELIVKTYCIIICLL